MITSIISSVPSCCKLSSTQIQKISTTVAVASAVVYLLGVLASQGILFLPLSIAWMISGGVGILGGALTAYFCSRKPSAPPEPLDETTSMRDETTSMRDEADVRESVESSCKRYAKQWNTRSIFEDEIVSYLVSITSEKEMLNLTFFNSGYLFDDFVILEKFFSKLRGNNWKGNIQVNIIDIQFQNNASKPEIVEAIKKIDSPSSLDILFYDSHTSFMEKVALDERNRTDCLVGIEDTSADEKALKELYQTTLSREGVYATLRKNQEKIFLEFVKRRVEEQEKGFFITDRVAFQTFQKAIRCGNTYFRVNLNPRLCALSDRDINRFQHLITEPYHEWRYVGPIPQHQNTA